jgi:hypothetical protein
VQDISDVQNSRRIVDANTPRDGPRTTTLPAHINPAPTPAPLYRRSTITHSNDPDPPMMKREATRMQLVVSSALSVMRGSTNSCPLANRRTVRTILQDVPVTIGHTRKLASRAQIGGRPAAWVAAVYLTISAPGCRRWTVHCVLSRTRISLA